MNMLINFEGDWVPRFESSSLRHCLLRLWAQNRPYMTGKSPLPSLKLADGNPLKGEMPGDVPKRLFMKIFCPGKGAEESKHSSTL